MGEISTVGLDIAKSVFQVHDVDVDGAVLIRKRISRAKVLEFFAELAPCLVGIEACPSAHHWSRKLQVLGHTVRLMPPSYVKAYLKRSKNEANDAAAICEAVMRPSTKPTGITDGRRESWTGDTTTHGSPNDRQFNAKPIAKNGLHQRQFQTKDFSVLTLQNENINLANFRIGSERRM